jgi:hypothetical protein
MSGDSDKTSNFIKVLLMLIRLVIKNIKWNQDEMRKINFCIYVQDKKPLRIGHAKRFDFSVRSGGPDKCSSEPLVYRLRFLLDSLIPRLEISW